MSEPLRIPIDQLKTAFELLIQRLAESEGDTIALQRDYFWSIVDPSKLYDVYESPGEPSIGQLTESWQHIQQVLADEANAIPHTLVWLADIIRALGHDQTRKPLAPPN